MANRELANLFSQIADLLEIKGEDTFRVNAYRKVSRAVEGLTEDVADLLAAGKLDSVPGIGKSTTEKISQYVKEGKIDKHEELLASVPEGLPALLAIPGLGPKKVQAAWKHLHVESLNDLKKAIDSGKLAELSGFGAKSVENIREGIEFLERSAGRTPLGVAWPIAKALAESLKVAARLKHVEIAGSLRRGRETIGDVDLLCASDEGERVVKTFTTLPMAKAVRVAGDTKGTILVGTPEGGDLQVDLRVVPAESFGAALQYFTGSKEHNIRLRELAVKKKWKLNEYGLFDGDQQIAGKDEPGIYRKLGLPFIEPELREDRGEVDRANSLPTLITRDDIRGDLHMHSTYSDGRNTIEEMAMAARRRGYDYIAMCDHSRSEAIANGMSAERLLKQIGEIRELNKRLKGVTVLAGCECDILSDGTLDYPDEVLAECDIVVASVHMGMGQERAKVTRRTIQAMESPHVTIIGHPTGRLLGKREAMDLDIDAVIKAAVETHTALELNASWQRLDLKDTHARQAAEAGAMMAISTDAHSTDQLDQMEYGIRTAKRAWVTKDQVINTRTLAGLRKFIARKRRSDV
jgi:DNA polymerase (family 10)